MIGISEPEFDRNAEQFRRRMTLLVNATKAKAVNEVRRSTVRMRSLASKSAPKATGTLRSSLVATYARQGLEGVVSLNSPSHYGQWVEGVHNDYKLGRKPGTWPPPGPIRAWVMLRGLARKWDMSVDSATFLVRRKIGTKGTPAQPFLKPNFAIVAPEFNAAMDRVFSQAATNAARLIK